MDGMVRGFLALFIVIVAAVIQVEWIENTVAFSAVVLCFYKNIGHDGWKLVWIEED